MFFNVRNNAHLVVKCPDCKKKFNANECRPPKPNYVKVLQGKCLVEVSFHKYQHLAEWIMKVGLGRNADKLPTLPEDVDFQLTLKSFPPNLANTGSSLIKKCSSLKRSHSNSSSSNNSSRHDSNCSRSKK